MRRFFVALTRNVISLAGAALTTATAVLILALFGLELMGREGSPYAGILTFVLLPSIFLLGLLMIPAGMWLQRRRARRDKTIPALPVIDLNRDRVKRAALIFLALTSANVLILGFSTYKGVEVMDSTAFCGTTCHTVMQPEYTNYQRSPHSRVPCVSCHIGPGAGSFLKAKLTGSWQLMAVMFDLYPRPIPTPVHNLRSARDTCEQCHWPSKFVGDRLKVITHYADDEASTENKTVLVLRVGGQQGSASGGIHWHADPRLRIRYRSDRTRETISEVELTRPDGSVDVFYAPGVVSDNADGPPRKAASVSSDGATAWRTMDCVDCHNRASHIFRMPEDEIDLAIQTGRIDRNLPYIRREGLKALRGTYNSHEEGSEKIAEHLRAFYADDPALSSTKASTIEHAASEIGQMYRTNIFPTMKITWGTYLSHLGHKNSPGCFRCHDDAHKTADGKAITQDCSTCHTLLAMEEENPEILKQLQP